MLHEIDATDKALGRLASNIAVILRGKTNPSYNPSVMPQEKVIVSNIGKLRFTGKKAEQKIYYHYSGYPSGMKARKLGIEFEKNPKKILLLAVYRMLAPNKLRSKIIKNLEIK
ncbi:MAG: 50S ribosomal protein L13 [Candidatus Yanofskybacteria bacterium RIFCSPHIGHO2_01_FULL_44_17]|uniref:50S ribosomal protein L13 n=1 Tax=Candidatus Yanofskybacteria bacterium RIFCSPHIGHO2_01_FULL_44_17 TaxID=1802668 RepID=A0A1F8EXJ1_9BACT|nr:MAG: 50S ribosomal protein L13 [Candidatus Yanofskybacteria bacterium RIFCSPHIGHO2_01_FULL_44_17]